MGDSTQKNQVWRVRGSLEVLTPLHVGDGEVEERQGETDVATVCRDANGQPYLPGTSLRGFLRRCFENFFSEKSEETRELFGYQEESGEGEQAAAKGGLLVVLDAFAQGAVKMAHSSHVVIERRTRTAAEELLYTVEIVEPGTKFDVTLIVEGIRLTEGDDTAVARLLAVLNKIHQTGERMGAGGASNWGQLRWTERDVCRLDEAAILAWEKKGGLLLDHLSKAKVAPAELPKLNRWLDLAVELQFDEMLLVKDPDLSKGGKAAKDGPRDSEARRKVLPGGQECALLPGHSFHGAMRSQAERIARTMAGDENAETWVRDVRKPAAYPEEMKDYTAVDLLFGGVGWKSPIRIDEDFCDDGKAALKVQEFIAIDRFTGGGVEGLKFNARGFERPLLRGRIRIDLNALRWLLKKGKPPQVRKGEEATWETLWYLLAFTLRDLVEGEISFGFGASKGYGTCRACFPSNGVEQVVETLKQLEEACHG